MLESYSQFTKESFYKKFNESYIRSILADLFDIVSHNSEMRIERLESNNAYWVYMDISGNAN